MIVGFTTIYAISAYHHWCCEFESRSGWSDKCTALCDKVCQWLATGWWFSSGLLVSSINKTDCHNITEILLKVVLNTITLSNKQSIIIGVESKKIQIIKQLYWCSHISWYGILMCFNSSHYLTWKHIVITGDTDQKISSEV